MKNRGVAVALALFLGSVGIHKFYLGRIGQGFLYVLFIWTFIPIILSFIDAVRLSFMSEDKFQKLYCVK